MVRAVTRRVGGHGPRISVGTCTHWLRVRIVDSPCVIGLPINDELFSADVEQLLVPNAAPDEIVVLDNPGADEGRRAQRVARLNHLMRATWPRTAEATWREVGALLDLVGPAA